LWPPRPGVNAGPNTGCAGNGRKRPLCLHKRLPEAKTSHDKDVLHRQIDATDRRINRLVYELYDLTAEEIAIVGMRMG